jgi:phosphohistidine phosphatase SixA
VRQNRQFGYRKIAVALAALAGLSAAGAATASEALLWEAIRSGGHVVLLRHALAPGTGDPTDFRVEDCATQRNLSDTGRDQARRIGARLAANGVGEAAVFSSQWCRCLETAKLLGVGPVSELALLNSFFRDYQRAGAQTQRLGAWLAARDLNQPLLLVTHQVNITALTNVYPRSGEMVIVRRDASGAFSVVGTIPTD